MILCVKLIYWADKYPPNVSHYLHVQVKEMNKKRPTRRRATPACLKCGMGMRRLYVHMGADGKQRTLGVAWGCMNCKTVNWDYSSMRNEHIIQQKIEEPVKGT